ncbi:hypothetical protein HRW14_32790 [Streptomyces lunaelactis]|uniref:hypothetical protein n=1 Tax=Streptomyces lunaelactis TaxID=1535768 RepID=UPI001585495D|nr:hypothetical protein [Streptomyces lunaelactis]NUK54946.1 hypothetical protein [Streptomyces lunaelactis]
MARITATIKAVHADGTVCTHKRRSNGDGDEPGCTGRRGYTASCSACDWTEKHGQQTVLAYTRDQHLRSHLTQPAAPVSA